jgi:hypothetical protein
MKKNHINTVIISCFETERKKHKHFREEYQHKRYWASAESAARAFATGMSCDRLLVDEIGDAAGQEVTT